MSSTIDINLKKPISEMRMVSMFDAVHLWNYLKASVSFYLFLPGSITFIDIGFLSPAITHAILFGIVTTAWLWWNRLTPTVIRQELDSILNPSMMIGSSVKTH